MQPDETHWQKVCVCTYRAPSYHREAYIIITIFFYYNKPRAIIDNKRIVRAYNGVVSS